MTGPVSDPVSDRRFIKGWCALCRSRCGCISEIADGRLVAVRPDPSHPTGKALCGKGRAAPELVHHTDRLTHPLLRTTPKGSADPGWRRIAWAEALDLAAERLRAIADIHGREGVAFAVTSPSGSSISDAAPWIDRLVHCFDTPNICYATEVCNWHRDFATAFTFGTGLPPMDLARAGCVLLWGHNPSATWLARAEAIVAAKARGAKLVVADPRRAGLAAKADQWLRVRPGSDGALALAIAGEMIAHGWYDADFIRDWSNGPFLIREDEGRPLTAADLGLRLPGPSALVWDEATARPVPHEIEAVRLPPAVRPALRGRFVVDTVAGPVVCRPSFDLHAELCSRYSPERAEAICWTPAADIRAAARLLWENRPVCYFTWSGVGQQTNATQTDRAIALIYALTGSFDAPGGNVAFSKLPAADVSGRDLGSAAQAAKALGLAARPIGPPRDRWVTSGDLYRAILAGDPYPVRGLLGFGSNLLLSHADVARGRAALRALDFFVQCDLFLTPTAAEADLVLPVASAWEREAVRVGFEIDQEAEAWVQYRPAMVPPAGEARSDMWIVFELAKRLGLGDRFWNGDVEAGWRALLAPTGLGLETLKASPGGTRLPLETRYRKYADGGPRPAGFPTPSRRVEIWSETLRRHGHAPLPEFAEPAPSVQRQPDLAGRFPLVLTSAKPLNYCHSQHRGMATLRRRAPEPTVELHPEAAAARGVRAGDWVRVETPTGRIRLKARFNAQLDPRVAVAQHGWWQACRDLGLDSYDPLSEDGANYNLLISDALADPVSGSVPHRGYPCEIRPLSSADEPAAAGAAR